MTETEMKLRDAARQMIILIESGKDDESVRSCLNAFISHGRSVTFVMQSESSDNSKLQQWYDERQAELKRDPLMRFFNEKRVHTIHRGVIAPKKKTFPIWDLKINGIPQIGKGTMTVLSFDGVDEYLPGHTANMYVLCEKYYIKLKALVHEWLKARAEFGLT